MIKQDNKSEIKHRRGQTIAEPLQSNKHIKLGFFSRETHRKVSIAKSPSSGGIVPLN
jgi:hypothetical protein